MDAQREPRLPALLSPAIQTATRWLCMGAMVVIGLIAFWLRMAKERTEPGESSRPRTLMRIDLNLAGDRELTLMPGIGTLTAERILEDRRQNGPFESLNDLKRVPGIGPKTIQEISPYCFVGSTSSVDARSPLASR